MASKRVIKLPLLPPLIGPDGPFNPSTLVELVVTDDDHGCAQVQLFIDNIGVTANVLVR